MQPIIRALTILRAVASADHGLNLQEIAERARLPLTSAHRVVAVLAEQEFLTRSPTNRRYFIGSAARELTERPTTPASGSLGRNPALEEAARASGETVFLTELIDGRAVCVSLIEAMRPLRLFVRIGQELPLHAAASARVLLADLPDEAVRRMLARTPDTPHSLEAILEHLELVRTRGYDVCEHELDAGVWAIAAPVRHSNGRVRASLTIAAPGARVGDAEVRERMIAEADAAAGLMSADLGFEAASHIRG